MTACSSKSTETNSVGTKKNVKLGVYTSYGGDGSKDLADYAAQKIKEKYPEVELIFEHTPSDGNQMIKTRAATGSLPDLITVNSGLIDTLTRSKSIIPIDSYIDKFNYKDKLTEPIIQNHLVSPDGHVYQFPTGGISPVLWFYNKKLFQDNNVKVPTNFDELMTAIKAFKTKGIIPIAMFGKEPWPLGAYFDSFVLKDNPAGINALSKGEAKASDPAYVKAIEKMEQTIKAGVFQSGATNTDFDTAAVLFTGGKAAMFLDGSWFTGEAFTKIKEDGDIMLSYPTADAGKETQNQYAMAGGGDTYGVAVSANTKDKDFAAEIASLFAYYREVAEYQQQQLITAPIKTDNLKLNMPLDPVSQKLSDALPNMTYKSQLLHNLSNTKFSVALTQELQKLIVGESKEDFINNLDKSIANTTGK